ncbi:MAG: hypothetical protein IJK97_00440 [Thermoguttaceae bacterium]|nr:hypothetical protein [Thermoguttaceae bacterium]MBQ9454592.1 hypothetical protein [Thermoguttaceae bacterium]
MNFQFYCPQGHLLQADSASAGSIISCPICGMQFIIPAAPVQPVVTPVVSVSPVSQPAETQEKPEQPQEDGLNFAAKGQRKSVKAANLDSLLEKAQNSEPAPAPDADDPLANITRRKAHKPAPKQATFSTEETKEILSTATKKKKKAEELDQFKIPCPNGHILEVDKEMLGERVQCPVCHAVYDLKLENSLEYIKEKKEEDELEEARLGKIWIQRAIIAGVLLLLFLIILMCT